jgi:flagellar biosynthetic protein FlhB
LSLLTGALALRFGGSIIGWGLVNVLRRSLQTLVTEEWTVAGTQLMARYLSVHTWTLSSTVILCVLVVGLTAALLQSGFALTAQPLTPDWGRLSPARGWQRIWSRRSALRGVLTTVRAAAMTALVIEVIRRDQPLLAGAGYSSLLHAIQVGWTVTIHVAAAVGVLLVILGIVDFAYQRWQFEQELMMTREEMKEERKQEEGDPHMRARIKRLQREMGQRLLAQVPRATVVLTNPTHFAVALRYERQSMPAPVVVAKGADFRAQRIIEIAQEHGVPVLERKPLARALYHTVPVGREIPPELYQAIAEVLAYLYRQTQPPK